MRKLFRKAFTMLLFACALAANAQTKEEVVLRVSDEDTSYVIVVSQEKVFTKRQLKDEYVRQRTASSERIDALKAELLLEEQFYQSINNKIKGL